MTKKHRHHPHGNKRWIIITMAMAAANLTPLASGVGTPLIWVCTQATGCKGRYLMQDGDKKIIHNKNQSKHYKRFNANANQTHFRPFLLCFANLGSTWFIMVLHGMVPWARLVTGRIAPAVSGRVRCLDVSARFGAYCTTSTWLTSPSSPIQL